MPAVALSLAIALGVFAIFGYIRTYSSVTNRTVQIFQYRMVAESVAKTFASIIAKGGRLSPNTLNVNPAAYANDAEFADDICNTARLIMPVGFLTDGDGFNKTMGRPHNDLSLLTGRNDVSTPQWCGTPIPLTTMGPGLYFSVTPSSVLPGSQMKALFDVLEKTDNGFGGVVIRAVRQTSTHLPDELKGTVLQITATIFAKSLTEKIMKRRDSVFYQVTHLYMARNILDYAFLAPGRLRLDVPFQRLPSAASASTLPTSTDYRNSDASLTRGDIVIPSSTMAQFSDANEVGVEFLSPVLVNGDIVLPGGPAANQSSLARFAKPVDSGFGTLMIPKGGKLVPYVPSKFTAQVRSNVEEINEFVRGHSGFSMLGTRSNALDINAGIAPGSTGTLSLTCINNNNNLDPTVSKNSSLVMKEDTSARELTSDPPKNPTVTLTKQTQKFISAYTNDKTVFVPQSDSGGTTAPQVFQNPADPHYQSVVQEDLSTETTHPIFKITMAMRQTYDTSIPTANYVTARLGLNQKLTTTIGRAKKCNSATIQADLDAAKTEKSSAQNAKDTAEGFAGDTKLPISTFYADAVAKAKAYKESSASGPGPTPTPSGTPTGTPAATPTPTETPTSTPTPSGSGSKLDDPDLGKWYDRNFDEPIPESSEGAADFIRQKITNKFTPDNYMAGNATPYGISSYGCSPGPECTAAAAAFTKLLARVHYQILKEKVDEIQGRIDELKVRQAYADNPTQVVFSVTPHYAGSEGEVQPNIAKFSVEFINLESWQHCGFTQATSPDITVEGYELGFNGAGVMSSGRVAHPLASSLHRLWWEYNSTSPRLDLHDAPANLGTAFNRMNPLATRPADPIGTIPDMTRNYAAEMRTCNETSAAPITDFDQLSKVAWKFASQGTSDLIIENNTVDDFVAPMGRANYQWPSQSVENLIVKSSAAVVLGNYVVNKSFIVEPRNTELIIISSMIVNHIEMHPTAQRAGIVWVASMDEAALKFAQRMHALGREMDCGVLNNPALLVLAPLWHPTLKMLGSGPSDISARMALSCTLAAIAPKLGEAFSSVDGSPPVVPDLATAAPQRNYRQYFNKSAWMHFAVSADLSDILF